MVFLLNIVVGLVLIVVQTALLPRFPVIENCYDLLLPFIIYQVVFRPARESAILVVVAGLLMDQLSGAPMGLYLIAYMWVMVSVRWGLQFLHMGNYYLVPFVVAVAVVMENMFFGLATVALKREFPLTQGRLVLGQVGWALISAPLFMMLLNAVHKGWAAWISNLNMEKNDTLS